MKSLTDIKLDQISIGFSLVCILHCLASFIALIVPLLGFWSITPGSVADYWFHSLLFFVGMPLSLLALHSGWRLHRRWSVVIPIVLGCTLLGVALFVQGETPHRLVTLSGAVILAIGHGKNLLDCRRANSTT